MSLFESPSREEDMGGGIDAFLHREKAYKKEN